MQVCLVCLSISTPCGVKGRGKTVQVVSRLIFVAFDFTFDDDGLSVFLSEFNLDFGKVFSVLDVIPHGRRATEDVRTVPQPKTNGTHDGRLAGSVGTNDEVHVWAGVELCLCVGDKVLHGESDDGSRGESNTHQYKHFLDE